MWAFEAFPYLDSDKFAIVEVGCFVLHSITCPKVVRNDSLPPMAKPLQPLIPRSKVGGDVNGYVVQRPQDSTWLEKASSIRKFMFGIAQV